MKQVIKGAIYSDGQRLLRPQFSGNYSLVDCIEYLTVKEIIDLYDKMNRISFIKDGVYLTCNGVRYYECEVRPHYTCDFELLSNLSELRYYDYETKF